MHVVQNSEEIKSKQYKVLSLLFLKFLASPPIDAYLHASVCKLTLRW